jgi:plastocyanin
MENVKKFFPLIIIVVAALVGGIIFYVWFVGMAPTLSEGNVPTDEETLPQRVGFAQLISFTDNGFEPKEATIQATETVRFINNSSEDLWVEGVASTDNPLYPEEGECGTTAFDSCKTLEPGEVWELEFDEQGTWLFRNKLNADQVGVVYVQ